MEPRPQTFRLAQNRRTDPRLDRPATAAKSTQQQLPPPLTNATLEPDRRPETRNHTEVGFDRRPTPVVRYRSARASPIIRFLCELARDLMARGSPAFSASLILPKGAPRRDGP